MNDTFKNYSRDCAHLLREMAIEAKNDAENASPDDQAFRGGYSMGLYAAVSLLHQQATSFQIPLEELALADFNPEDLLLKKPKS